MAALCGTLAGLAVLEWHRASRSELRDRTLTELPKVLFAEFPTASLTTPTVFQYLDYACQSCAKAEPQILSILEDNPWVKRFPIFRVDGRNAWAEELAWRALKASADYGFEEQHRRNLEIIAKGAFQDLRPTSSGQSPAWQKWRNIAAELELKGTPA